MTRDEPPDAYLLRARWLRRGFRFGCFLHELGYWMREVREEADAPSGLPEPYYADEFATIYHGDAREVVPALGEDVGLVLTDPPYGIGWKPRVNHQDQSWVDVRVDVSFAMVGLYHCVWGGNYFTDFVRPSESWLVWIKRPDGFNFDNDERSYSVCEMAWTDFGGKPRTKHLTWDGGMRAGDPSNRSFCHPAQKPLELMRWCIALCPDFTGVVLDPFMGSGTTLRAAKDMGRRTVGVELDESYCEIAAQRLAQGAFDFSGSPSQVDVETKGDRL